MAVCTFYALRELENIRIKQQLCCNIVFWLKILYTEHNIHKLDDTKNCLLCFVTIPQLYK